jgi:NTP pyrophosphatase (non-canonical NTP hydrolase)
MTEDLTPDQREALTILLEEAAELIQAISKMLRHGPDSVHPDGGNDGLTNEAHAAREMAQLILMLTVCHAAGLFADGRHDMAEMWMRDKLANMRRYSTIDHSILDKIEV